MREAKPVALAQETGSRECGSGILTPCSPVILSGVSASLREAGAESKDPCTCSNLNRCLKAFSRCGLIERIPRHVTADPIEHEVLRLRRNFATRSSGYAQDDNFGRGHPVRNQPHHSCVLTSITWHSCVAQEQITKERYK